MQTLILSLRDRFRCAVAVGLLAVLVSGCGKPASIETHKVPKPSKTQILAAILPVEGTAWFFKLSGQSKAVTAQEDNFEELLESLEVKRNGEPKWDLPDGWTEEPSEGMRLATLKVKGDGPTLECSVIGLPVRMGENPQSLEYTLANVNRWRGQLGLEKYSPQELQTAFQDDEEVHSLAVDRFLRLTWVNFEGRRGSVRRKSSQPPTANAGGPANPHGAAPFAGGGKSKKGGRMLAAIVPVGKAGWFFKLSGEEKQVAAEEKNFAALLKSLRIQDGRPVWKTPKSWHELAGEGLRKATFLIGEEPSQLECSVIPLPTDDPESKEYLLANINRWRGQVGLGGISEKQFVNGLKTADSGEIRQLKVDGGKVTVTWVNINDGSSGESDGAAGPPGSQPGAAGGPAPNRGGGPGLGISFQVPPGWTPAKPRTMVLVGWEVVDDQKKVEIYVSKLPARGSGLAVNVNRWRGQVGLQPLAENDVRNSVDPITIDGVTGYSATLRGATKTIIGATVIRNGTGWFFKLQGDPALAVQEETRFDTWLKSIRFE